MAKGKKQEDIETAVEETVETPVVETPKKLYKYEIGDEVFVMEDNKVKSFVIGKRIIMSRSNENNEIINEVYYDESNWSSLKAQYSEQYLFPSKQALLKSL